MLSVTPSIRASRRKRSMVLISPLCAKMLNGCTRQKAGSVFVL